MKLQGFTLIEILVTLVLTSAVVALSFNLLSNIQRNFERFRRQNSFVGEYTLLRNAMDEISRNSDWILEERRDFFKFNKGKVISSLEITPDFILISTEEVCDTFMLSVKNIRKDFELIENPKWAGKVLKTLTFQTIYKNQVFNFNFSKLHDASVKLAFETDKTM